MTLASANEPTGSRQESRRPGLSGVRSGKGFRTHNQRRAARGSWEKTVVHKKRGVAPNDLKLSDSGVRRDGCAVGLRGAAGVTHGAVRWSAWLGVADWVGTTANGRPKRWLGKGKLPPVAVTCAQLRQATPGEQRWVMRRLTTGLRTAKGDDVPGTDARCVERRRERQMTA